MRSAAPMPAAPMPAAQRISVVRATLDEPNEKPKITMEGIQKFRERQRLKWGSGPRGGAPLSVWTSVGIDRDPAELPDYEHEPVPPTQEQKDAADGLFEKALRDKNLPEGFGEGLDFGI